MADILTDEAIVDVFINMLKRDYFDDIQRLIAQKDMVLEVKEYDIPEEFIEGFWKKGEAEKYLVLLSKAVRRVFEDIYDPSLQENKDIPYDLIEGRVVVEDDKILTKIGKLTSRDLYRFISFEGIIVSQTSKFLTILKDKVFRCEDCNMKYTGKIPKKCTSCDSSDIELSIMESGKTSAQYITLQERYQDMPQSFTIPKQIEAMITGNLVGKFRNGEIVKVSGILKPKIRNSNEERQLQKKKTKTDVAASATMDAMFEVHNMHFIMQTHDRILANPRSYITEEDEKQILQLRKKHSDVELLNLLMHSFAPEIRGHELLKESILMQAVNGSEVEDQRNTINILIVGDPGLGKSRLLSAASKINLHYAKAIGKGTSGVGLTASIIKDTDNQPRLSIGAAVLADKGLCCIDELSNIDDEYKAHLLECMENGTFTVTKYGINQTLNTRAAFLVASNPDNGRYHSNNSLIENIKISPPLLSRFDLMFVVIDEANAKLDKELGVHITAIYNKKEAPKKETEPTRISEELLKKYVTFARLRQDHVYITKPAFKRFDAFYDDLRKPVISSDVTATPRQFIAMLRLSQALGRLLLKTEVTEEMAEIIINLMNEAFKSTGMRLGNSTGLNQNMIYSKPLNQIHPNKAFVLIMQRLTHDNRDSIEKEAVILELREKAKMDISDAYELWDKMNKKGALMVENGRFYKLNYDNLLS